MTCPETIYLVEDEIEVHCKLQEGHKGPHVTTGVDSYIIKREYDDFKPDDPWTYKIQRYEVRWTDETMTGKEYDKRRAAGEFV